MVQLGKCRAVHDGHPHIEQDDGRRRLADTGQGSLAVLSENYLVTFFLKGEPKRVTDGSVIIYNEDAGGSRWQRGGVNHC